MDARVAVVAVGMAMLAAACASGDDLVALSGPRPAAAAIDSVEGEAAPDGPLFVTGSDALGTVDPDTGAVLFAARGAVAAPDWSMLYRVDRSDDGLSRLIGIDPTTGQATAGLDLPPEAGELVVRLVAPAGLRVALMPPRVSSESPEDPYQPEGREITALVVAELDTGRHRTYELEGNFEPEAFTSDGGSIFVISYTPPSAPESYQVRRLDLASGEVLDVFSLDKELQEEMGGTARTQAWSPDGTRLYTLYTLENARTATRSAFIHVLSLEEQWAHCVDLPAPFGAAPETAIALAVSTDGRTLVVTDELSGTVAEVDTADLLVRGLDQIAQGVPSGTSVASIAGRTLWWASGATVTVVELGTLHVARRWTVSGEESIASMHVPGAGPVHVAVGNRVLLLDRVTGAVQAVIEPGFGTIQSIGRMAGGLGPERGAIECAC